MIKHSTVPQSVLYCCELVLAFRKIALARKGADSRGETAEKRLRMRECNELLTGIS